MITNILIILSGPIVSFYIIMAGKNFIFNSSFMKYIALGTAIALAVSILAHYIVRNNSKKANILSVIASVSIYALLAIATASDPETKMWLPVIIDISSSFFIAYRNLCFNWYWQNYAR